LEFLALIYVQQDTAHEVTDLGVDFLRGHLAVLFGLLMQRNDRHREALLHVLPGESDYIKVDLLVNQAREFVTFYSDLTAHLADAATKISMDPEMSLRTGNGIGSICKIIKEGRGEDVAHDVILYLERLKGHHSNP
jgi:hypothetical protein